MKSFDSLKKFILETLRRRKLHIQTGSLYASSGAVATFLRELLNEQNMSRDEFAIALDMEPELADAILDGVLPASEFNDELIDELVGLLDCSPHQLKKLLQEKPDGEDYSPKRHE